VQQSLNSVIDYSLRVPSFRSIRLAQPRAVTFRSNTITVMIMARAPSLNAGPANPASRTRPRKKGENSSRRAVIIAEVKMVRSRIVKIDGALDETQTEKRDVKIEVPLGIACDRSDAM